MRKVALTNAVVALLLGVAGLVSIVARCHPVELPEDALDFPAIDDPSPGGRL